MPDDPYPELFSSIAWNGTLAIGVISLVPGGLHMTIQPYSEVRGLAIPPNELVREDLASDGSRFSRLATLGSRPFASARTVEQRESEKTYEQTERTPRPNPRRRSAPPGPMLVGGNRVVFE